MIVLDTNVLSELARVEPDRSVLAWLDALDAGRVTTTAVTAAELRYGVERLPDGRRKTLLRAAVEGLLRDDLRRRVEPFDAAASVRYALLVARRERQGRPISGADAQIAAICQARAATLATRNVTDFADTGVEVVDPWASAGGP